MSLLLNAETICRGKPSTTEEELMSMVVSFSLLKVAERMSGNPAEATCQAEPWKAALACGSASPNW